MIDKKRLKQFFGVGPIGGLFSILCWVVAYKINAALEISKILISPTIRTVLLIIFIIDVVYLLIGSNYQLQKHGRGKTLITEGPYQFIRHPLYSVWIYSLTGILAMTMLSWSIIIMVIPINLFWSWLVTREENEMIEKFGIKYQDYMERTGQFLPSWKAMKESIKESNN